MTGTELKPPLADDELVGNVLFPLRPRLFSGAFYIDKLTRAVPQSLNLKEETSRIGRDGNYVTQWAAQSEDWLVGPLLQLL